MPPIGYFLDECVTSLILLLSLIGLRIPNLVVFALKGIQCGTCWRRLASSKKKKMVVCWYYMEHFQTTPFFFFGFASFKLNFLGITKVVA